MCKCVPDKKIKVREKEKLGLIIMIEEIYGREIWEEKRQEGRRKEREEENRKLSS